jgi:hypothetical protein
MNLPNTSARTYMRSCAGATWNCCRFYFVFEGGDREWALSAIRFRYVPSLARQCPVRSPLDPSVQILSTSHSGTAHVAFDYFPQSLPLRHAYFVAQSHTPRNCCVRFVAGVTDGSRPSRPGELPSRSGELPSRPGELHPEPLTEPDLGLSTYPARATH